MGKRGMKRGEVEEGLAEGVAVGGLEAFVFDAEGAGWGLFEQIEGETADDGEGFRGVPGSDARVILHSAIALW
jgi:hypothetical protein